jgi:hypothetical protein
LKPLSALCDVHVPMQLWALILVQAADSSEYGFTQD